MDVDYPATSFSNLSLSPDVDEVTDSFMALSLAPGKPAEPIRPSRSTNPKKPSNPAAHLNAMPPEIVLLLFYELIGGSDSRIGDAFSLAISSKKLYSCFKDSEFTIFRRTVMAILDSGPVFCDLVLRIGSLHSTTPSPTDPVDVREKIMDSLRSCGFDPMVSTSHGRRSAYGQSAMQPWRERLASMENRGSQLHEIVTRPLYRSILTWIRPEIPFSLGASRYSFLGYERYKQPHDDLMVRNNMPGLPAMDWLGRHPYRSLFLDYYELTPKKRGDSYRRMLLAEAVRYGKHSRLPWTEAEDRFLSTHEYIPCCLMGFDCPRIPEVSRESPIIPTWLMPE